MSLATVRQQIAAGRQQLHRQAAVRAYYMADGATAQAVTVRLHRRNRPVGDGLPGHGFIADILPKILFLESETKPTIDRYVIFAEQDEVYFIKNVLPSDGAVIVAEAVFLAGSERPGLDFAVTLEDLATDQAKDSPGQFRYLLDTTAPGLINSNGQDWVRLADTSVVVVPNPAVVYVRVDGIGRIRITGADVFRTAGVS